MTLTKKDLIKYVSEKWWVESHDLPTYSEQLEPLIKKFYEEFNIPYPGHNKIEDLSIDICDEVINKLKKKQDEQREIDEQLMIEAQIKFNRAKKEIEQKARTHKNRAKLDQIKSLKCCEGLSDDAINVLYNLYVSIWDELHQEQSPSGSGSSSQPKPKKPKEKSFKQKIRDFVIIHPDELLTPEEFKNVIKGWNRDMTEQQAYKFYQDEFFAVPGVSIKIDEPKKLDKLGFKDENKYIFGTRAYEIKPKFNYTISNSFPLKENKKYQLHKIAPRGTYIIDFMFNGKLTYLVAINVNTRYGCVELTNISNEQGETLKQDAKTSSSYLKALNKIMNEVKLMNPIKHLTGDGEGAFTSRVSQQFYQQHNITFHPVPRMSIEGKKATDPLHSSLALIDRFVRTIRDMIFHAGYNLTPLAIKEMVRQYNNAPHSTLSKYIGFDVSPLMVQQDKNKEEYIMMKINKENIATKLSYGFEIPIGARVKVYNEKNVLGKRRRIANPGTIEGLSGSLYRVKIQFPNGQTKIELVPRYKLDFG